MKPQRSIVAAEQNVPTIHSTEELLRVTPVSPSSVCGESSFPPTSTPKVVV